MESIADLIVTIIAVFGDIVFSVYNVVSQGAFDNVGFNIYLFSDTGWFTRPIYIREIVIIICTTFMFVFIIRLLWKGTKKFITMVFGVFRV